MMQADESERSLAPAARLQRLAGFILDASLFWLLAATTVSLVQAVRSAIAAAQEEGPNPSLAQLTDSASSLGSWLPMLPLSPLAIVATLYAIYSMLWWWRTGRSPGKWLVGIEIVRPDGGRPGFLRTLVRVLVIAVWIGVGLGVGLVVPSTAPRLFSELPFIGLIALISWVPALVRDDRATLHDLIAGTRVVRAQASGIRIMTRGTLRRAISDVRWAVAIVALILLSSAGLFFGSRLLIQDGNTAGGAAAAAPVDQLTQEAIRGALLEYNRMEEHATYRLDASILEPRATQTWLARKQEEFAQLRRRGIRQESRLLNSDFKSFRWVGDNSIETDVVETWVTLVADVTGRQLQERAAHDVPQTAILIRDRGRWKLNDVRHYDEGQNPF